MFRNVTAQAAALILTVCVCSTADAQLFGRRAAASRSSGNSSATSSVVPRHLQHVYNPANRPLNRLQTKRVERTYEKDVREADRKGITVQQAADQRIRRLQTLAAVVGGLGQGFSAASSAASSWQPTSPTIPAGTAGTSVNQHLWNSYNQHYNSDVRFQFLNQMQ